MDFAAGVMTGLPLGASGAVLIYLVWRYLFVDLEDE